MTTQKKSTLEIVTGILTILISAAAFVWSLVVYNVSYKREYVKAQYDQKASTYIKFVKTCASLKTYSKDSIDDTVKKKKYDQDLFDFDTMVQGELRIIGDSDIVSKAEHFRLSLKTYHQSSVSDSKEMDSDYANLCNALKGSLNETIK